jgi:MFS transporter, AAHS family, 4-hydroxybenzoate transporter
MDNKKIVEVGEVIDSARFFPVPFTIALMMIIIMLTDGFDLGTMGRVATPLSGEFGDGALNPINTAGLAGMALGSVFMGWLGDRIGRKRSYIACVALLFVGSLLCYYAQSLTQLWLFRGITGLGLGGVTPLAATLMSEWAPKRVRSIAVAAVVVAVPLGAALAGPVERMIVPEYGWRSMFLVGAIAPLVLFAIFAFLLPESPKYMARHPSQHPKLARALNRLVGEKRFDGTEQFVVQEGSAHSSNWFATIWNKQYAKATLFIWIAFAMNSFVLYVFTNYLQRILGRAQLPADVASSAADLFFYGAFFGSIGGAVLIGYLGSRLVGTGLALLGVGSAAALGVVLAPDMAPATLLVLCMFAGMAVNGMQAFMYAVAANAYPTEVRGSAVGVAQTVSRVGAILSPTAYAAYFVVGTEPPVGPYLWFVAGCAVVTTVSFFLIPRHIAAGAHKTI